MQLIEAALAFAITMLALSLVVSSFVEIIHRICSMREAGLKYVLGQMLDQVLDKHIRSGIEARVRGDDSITNKDAKIGELVEQARRGFVERMSANRAPMGVAPNATPTEPPPTPPASSNPEPEPSLLSNIRLALSKIWSRLPNVRLWNGRDLAAMTPAEFMERLGSMEDVGHAIAKVNDTANAAAQNAGAAAADAVNVVLKDVAQKFEAFGREASAYFEGRARLLSVVVAIALAFAAHVDAIDLFRTYLRDPNARAKVIEQSGAVTAQYKSAQETIAALNDMKSKPPTAAPQVEKPAVETEEEKKKEAEKTAADAKKAEEDLDKQIEALKKDALDTIANARESVKQFADLGVPLGWNPERIKRAEMWEGVWTCKGDGFFSTLWKDCNKRQKDYNIWFQMPTVLSVWFYLFLGGLLVGLGAPFWYNAVTGLTNIRNTARGVTSADAQTRAGALVAAGAGTVQPVTPVDAFLVSNGARR
jgi:hypothetical protein